jgi:phosphotransacetylase
MLLGAAKPVHILPPETSRRIINMTAVAVADVNDAEKAS